MTFLNAFIIAKVEVKIEIETSVSIRRRFTLGFTRKPMAMALVKLLKAKKEAPPM